MTTQLPIPDFMRRSARAAKRAAVALLVSTGLLVDIFAGFGGGSIATERAHGRPVDVAINHWPKAIEFHTRNHPEPTVHLTADIREVDPDEVIGGRDVLHIHFSPDCRHFSSAKGGQPVSDKVRALPWVILQWAKFKPALITMENVKEFLTWGPTEPVLKRGKFQYWPDGTMKRVPVKEKKGLTFKIWLGRLEALGYKVEWKVLDAADYGAPTHRRRLFLVARCDGQPIVWPEPTHGPGREHAYRTAAECIDFSRPCPSVFMDKREALGYQKMTGIRCNRPLADKTLWRIAEGLRRFVILADKPFIVQTGYGERPGQAARINNIDDPLGTVVGSQKHGVVAPALAKYFGQGVGQPVDEPAHTITTKDRFGLIAANMVRANHGNAVGEMRGQKIDKPVDRPAPTVTANPKGGGWALSQITLKKLEEHHETYRGMLSIDSKRSDPYRRLREYLEGIRDQEHRQAGENFTAKNGAGREEWIPLYTHKLQEKVVPIDGASRSVDSGERIDTHKSGDQSQGSESSKQSLIESGISNPIRKSFPRISKRQGCADHSKQSMAGSGNSSNQRCSCGCSESSQEGDELRENCQSDGDLHDTSLQHCSGLQYFSSWITKFYGTATGQSILKPLATVTADAGGGHLGTVHAFLSQGVDEASLAGFWRVYAFLVKHLGPDAPLPLVYADGHLFLIVDIGMRMLEPRELLNAQFTPELARDYVLPTNKSLAVKLIGNSVSPPVLEALIRAQGIGRPRKRRAA